MHAILEVFLKVLDHAERQRRVHLAGAVVAADARQVHDFAALWSARAGRWWLGRADDGVGAGGDEVGFHHGFEVGVWVAVAEDGDAGVEPGGRTWLWERVVLVIVSRNTWGFVGSFAYRCLVGVGPARSFHAALVVVV